MKANRRFRILIITLLCLICFSGCKKEKTYTINYELDGGMIETTYSTSFKENENVVLPTPIKEDYEFIGWYQNGNQITSITNQNYQLVARWIRIYHIEYELDGGTLLENMPTSFKENENIELPTPKKDNCRFLGWYQDNELVTSITNQDYQLKAKWERIYTISYELNGGNLSSNAKTSFKENETVSLITPTKEGFVFDGWYQSGELVTTITNQDYYLIAKWKQVFKISYQTDGGMLPGTTITKFFEDEIVELPIPKKDNYEFLGWYQNDELVTTITNQDYQLTAKWERIYKITYYLYGGKFEETALYKIKDDEEYYLLIPQKEGFIFKGWFNNSKFTGDEITKINQGTTDDIKLYACFEKVYQITYIIDDGQMPEEYINYYYPEKGEELPIPTRNGYRFLGWSERPNASDHYSIVPISFEQDLILYPGWEKVNYQMNYQFPYKIFANKDHLFVSFFTDFYNYIVSYRNEANYLESCGIKSVQDFLEVAGNWSGGASGMGRIGNIAGKYYLKIDVGGDIHNQTSDDGFIGYCLENDNYSELIYFLQEFFYWWRKDEGYTGGPDDPNNVGSDFLASAWASLVDTAKFFYFEKDTLPSYFIRKGHVPEMYDRIPYIVKTENFELNYEYDWEKGIDLPNDMIIYGYKFLGWYDNPEYIGTPITKVEIGIYHDVIVYAKLEKLVKITLVCNTEEDEKSYVFVSINEEQELPKITCDGYTFVGWYNNADYTGEAITSIRTSNFNDITLYAKWEKINYTISYIYGKDLYANKQELFTAYFTEFYYYIVDYRNESSSLVRNNIYTVKDFLSIASDLNAGRGEMRHIGDIAGTFYLKKDTGGDINDQTADDGFIGYCLENNKFVDLVYFLQEFFFWWRKDEGYTTDTNNGSDFLHDRWASLVDTAKFFYFEKETLPSYFIKREHVPAMYDKIPHLIDISNIPFEKEYDWEIGIENLPILEREGYTFIGWYDNADYIGEVIASIKSKVFNDIVLYAKWEKISKMH